MKLLLILCSLFVSSTLLAQAPYWQQQLRYTIETELNPATKSLTGQETIVYKNNSPETLNFIWFHLWPNAYKNDSTALLRQLRQDEKGKEKVKSYGTGSIDGLSFKVNDQPATTEAHPNQWYIDIIKVVLPKPLAPGDSVTISTPFQVKLPPYFSRSGFSGDEFMICQWYPKPAVFDASGWHEFPYLDRGEFYSEYADYSVSITLPSAFAVGATGTLQTREELERYKKLGAKNVATRNKLTAYAPEGNQPKKTLRYVAKQVPDFAWFADKTFIIQYDTVQVQGKTIDAFSYFHDRKKSPWENSIDFVKDAVKKYSQWVGPYEYPVVQAVEGPSNLSSGGMEYPMVTLITSPDSKPEPLDAVIAHEVGHNWFMSMLGSNERDHAWMDEGLNTYFQFRYEAEKYRANSIFGESIPDQLKKLPADQFLNRIYTVIEGNVPMQAAMDKPSDQFQSSEDYGLASYLKPALWMYLLESAVGPEKAELAVKNYFNKWKFKHPQPADMQAAFEEAVGASLAEFFLLTKKEGKFE